MTVIILSLSNVGQVRGSSLSLPVERGKVGKRAITAVIYGQVINTDRIYSGSNK